MKETLVKTHLIVTDVHEEYFVHWFGKIKDTNPVIHDGKPIFILISNDTRLELNTLNMPYIEKCAKMIAHPHGRAAVTTGFTDIFIKEVGGKQTRIGQVSHSHVKQYAPMYDKVWEQ